MSSECHYILYDFARCSFVEVCSPVTEEWEKVEFSSAEDAEEFVKSRYQPVYTEDSAYAMCIYRVIPDTICYEFVKNI